MLTDEDLKMIAALLDERGLKKLPSAAVLRTRRWRERHKTSQAASQNVTPSQRKASQARNGHVTFDWDAYQFGGITPDDMRRWQEAYPAISIPDHIERAAIWLKANPKNRKSNYERFLANWFTRGQDRAARSS